METALKIEFHWRVPMWESFVLQVDWLCKVSQLNFAFLKLKNLLVCKACSFYLGYWGTAHRAHRHFKTDFSVFCPPTPPISGAPLAGLGYQEAQADPVQWLRLKLWVWEWWWGQPSACYMRVGCTTHPLVDCCMCMKYYQYHYSSKPLIQTSEPSKLLHTQIVFTYVSISVIRTPISRSMFECI